MSPSSIHMRINQMLDLATFVALINFPKSIIHINCKLLMLRKELHVTIFRGILSRHKNNILNITNVTRNEKMSLIQKFLHNTYTFESAKCIRNLKRKNADNVSTKMRINISLNIILINI